MQLQKYWLLVVIISVGIMSRTAHTGWIILDKYLGDALYAAMVYVLLSLFWQVAPMRKAIAAMFLMTALELFQLTRIPANLYTNNNVILKTIARLLGTEFSIQDLLAYGTGIITIAWIEFTRAKNWNKSRSSMLE